MDQRLSCSPPAPCPMPALRDRAPIASTPPRHRQAENSPRSPPHQRASSPTRRGIAANRDPPRGWHEILHGQASSADAEQSDRVHELHRRASAWYEASGERPEAIHHAMAGQDVERAADLVELAIPAMRQARQEATVRGWLEALPEELFQHRPVLRRCAPRWRPPSPRMNLPAIVRSPVPISPPPSTARYPACGGSRGAPHHVPAPDQWIDHGWPARHRHIRVAQRAR